MRRVALLWSVGFVALAPAALPAQRRAPDTVVLQGRVTDERGESQVAAKVEAFDWYDPTVTLATGVTDGSGCFRIGRVPRCTNYGVRARIPGRSHSVAWSNAPDQPVRLRVGDGATVRGVLRNADAQPVAGTEVRCCPVGPSTWNSDVVATTDAQGAFALDGVSFGAVNVLAAVPGEGLYGAHCRITGDREITLVHVVERTTRLTIQVAGGMVPGLRFHLEAPEPTMVPQPWLHPRPDADGQARIEHLVDRRYRVTASAPGVVFEPRSHVVEPGKDANEVTFRVLPAGASPPTLRAVVRDPTGRPVVGARFTLQRPLPGSQGSEGVSGVGGKLAIVAPVEPGEEVHIRSADDLWVTDQAPRHSAFLSEWNLYRCVFAPDTELVVPVVRASTVQGLILRADGSPAAFTNVMLVGERNQFFAMAVTDYAGRFTLPRLHAVDAPLRLTVAGEDGTGLGEPFAFATLGATVTAPELRLAAPAIVTGVVRDPQGHPLPGVHVQLTGWVETRKAPTTQMATVTDREGRYVCLGVAAGTVKVDALVAVRYDQVAGTHDPIEVAAGGSYTIDLTARLP